MLTTLERWVTFAANWIWGLPLLMLLTGGGLYFLLRTRLLPLFRFGHAVRVLSGRHEPSGAPGDVSYYRALAVALASTIGMGNVSGVAIAISLGGPGAVLWMWVSAIVGTATQYVTCTLAVMYRGRDSQGRVQGGPMYVITEGLGPRWRPLAVLFAVAGMFGCLPVFNVNQLTAASVTIGFGGASESEVGTVRWVLGLSFAVLTGIVVFGGLARISRVVASLVPAMVALYFVAVAGILAAHAGELPGILGAIVRDAFAAEHYRGDAMFGGALGGLVVLGLRRAAFSNEAGLGTASLAHGAARSTEPVHQGLVSMLGPVIDTLVVCTLTALAILATGVWQASDATGVELTLAAFRDAYPRIGAGLLFACVACFSLSSLFTYAYFGEKCCSFLVGVERARHYRTLYVVSIVAGATSSLGLVVNFIDLMFALMAIPTMASALLLTPRVLAESRRYWAARAAGTMARP